MSIEIVTDIIKKRRSIFPSMYSSEKIPEEDIQLLLENANEAPTHRKTEPWRFHVLSDSKLVAFSQFAGQWYKSNTPKENFSELKYQKTINKPLQSSHVIGLCMQRDPKESVPEWEEIASVAMAVQNMWISCTAMNIGCYWSSPKSIHDAHQILDLNDGERCLGWFYLGIPKANLELSVPKGSVEQKVKWYK